MNLLSRYDYPRPEILKLQAGQGFS